MNNYFTRISFLFTFLIQIILCSCAFSGNTAPLSMDGIFHDWNEIAPAHTDPQGDSGTLPVDFRNLWIANDDEFLFIRFETGDEIKLNQHNDVNLYIDLDSNNATGKSIRGMGADLQWDFGGRFGMEHLSDFRYIDWIDIELIRSPTVSSSEFEMKISRNPDMSVNVSDNVRILLQDESSGGGDVIPDENYIDYSFTDTSPPEPEIISLEKSNNKDIRVLSYNVLFNGLFERSAPFERILPAINPDIINFQEIWSYTSLQTRNKIEEILPSPEGEQWYYNGNNDCITLTRYPMTKMWNIDGNLAVLIDTPDNSGMEYMLVINAHLPCCSNDEDRQKEVDSIMSFIRDARNPGGSVTLSSNTPIVIVGDMNLVGWAQQLETFLTGDIVNENTYGEDFLPDWDGTTIADSMPRHTNTRSVYTWRSETSSYAPGRLDFIFYTDSVMKIAKKFVLMTSEMTAQQLEEYNLNAGDVSQASDHFPVVTDFNNRPVPDAWIAH